MKYVFYLRLSVSISLSSSLSEKVWSL